MFKPTVHYKETSAICPTYDEITNIDPETLSQLCYSVTQGRNNQDTVLGVSGRSQKEISARWKIVWI